MYKERKLLVAEKGNLFACLLYYPIVIWDIFGLTKALKIHNLLDDFFSSQLLNRTESEEEEGHNTTKMLKTMSVSKL